MSQSVPLGPSYLTMPYVELVKHALKLKRLTIVPVMNVGIHSLQTIMFCNESGQGTHLKNAIIQIACSTMKMLFVITCQDISIFIIESGVHQEYNTKVTFTVLPMHTSLNAQFQCKIFSMKSIKHCQIPCRSVHIILCAVPHSVRDIR